jgi:hypothetical protein
MEPQIYWYELLFMGLLASTIVAYPTVALFVTRRYSVDYV